MSGLIAAISFDPTIRGILVVVVAVTVLCGSVYAIIATNTGMRLGFLIAATGLFGWCTLMGIMWWVYGIGFVGRAPAWEGIEVNFNRNQELSFPEANKLPREDKLPTPLDLLDKYPAVKATAMKDPAFAAIVNDNSKPTSFDGQAQDRLTLSKVITLDGSIQSALNKDLGGWRILPESDSRRGETVAASDAILTSALGQTATGFAASSDYYPEDVFYFGGKSSTEPLPGGKKRGIFSAAWERVVSIAEVKNPPLYAAVTLKMAKKFPDDPSTAPPPPQPRTDVSTITVLMRRNLGNKRAVPAAFALISACLFALFAYLLHSRDKVVMAQSSAA